MAAFFFDSSAIAKRYVVETGTAFVEGLAEAKSGNIVLLARLTRVEVAAALARRLKGGSLTIADARNALAFFQYDSTNSYFTIEITPLLLAEAVRLTTKHALRGYDAVQLSAALEANRERDAHRLAPVTLVSADTELNTAAQSEGLNVENPNNYP